MDEQLTKSLEQIGDNQKRALDRLDSVEKSQKEIAEKVGGLGAEVKTAQEHLAEIEARAKSARRGDSVTDNLREAIPERMRGMIGAFARTCKKDPVADAAREAWLKNHLRMQMPQFSREFSRLAEENDRLAQAMGEEKAYMNESTGAQGAFGVPQYVESEIFRVIEDNGLVRGVARNLVIATKKTTLVNVASNVTAYVVDELGGSITAGEPTFGSATLTVKDYVAYGQASIDVLQDEVVGLLNFFAINAGEMIAAKEDNLALEGTTTDTVVGILSQATTTTYTIGKVIYTALTSATNAPTMPTLGQLAKNVYGVAAKNARTNGGAWFMHPATWAQIIGNTSSSLPVLSTQVWWAQSNTQAPKVEGSLLGFPVFVTPQIASATAGANIYFGGFKNLIYGDRTGIDFGITDAEKFQYGLISLRVIKRTGIVVANPHAFAILTKATN